jgi:hypothetical protein
MNLPGYFRSKCLHTGLFCLATYDLEVNKGIGIALYTSSVAIYNWFRSGTIITEWCDPLIGLCGSPGLYLEMIRRMLNIIRKPSSNGNPNPLHLHGTNVITSYFPNNLHVGKTSKGYTKEQSLNCQIFQFGSYKCQYIISQ